MSFRPREKEKKRIAVVKSSRSSYYTGFGSLINLEALSLGLRSFGSE